MMPSWKACLQTLVLLSIAGFVLVLVNGFLKVLIVLALAAAVIWLWRHWPSARK